MRWPRREQQGRGWARAPAPTARRALRGAWLLALLLGAGARCTFPDYQTGPAEREPGPGGAGSEQSGGVPSQAEARAGAPAQGGSGESTSAGGAGPDGGAPGGGAGAPECAPEQWPVERCEASCLHRFPSHCYDGRQDDDEASSDCGDSCQGCTNEACSSDSDCLSSDCESDMAGAARCFAPLGIRYTAHEQSSLVGSTAWSITLENDEPAGGRAFELKDLKLRYYLQRSGLVEPLVVHATQSNLRLADGQSRELTETSWLVTRTEPSDTAVYDAYVEVGFGDGGQLYPGDAVDLYQQLITGDPAGSQLDQRENYSFTPQSDVPWLHVSVLYRDQLMWGLEPEPVNPRACFVRGVNLNGVALVSEGRQYQDAVQAGVSTSGSAQSVSSALSPPASAALTQLLQTSVLLQAGNDLSVPVDSGTYLLYLDATSVSNDGTASDFTVQGEAPAVGGKFRAQTAEDGQAWARLGPFRVDVESGSLQVAVTSGAVSFAALELWYPD